MLLQLLHQISQGVDLKKNSEEKAKDTLADITNSREHLYGLLCFVQQEITRTEQLFNLAEDEALIDNSIYQLKSLRAQQQFLVQNIRRLDRVGAAAELAAENTEEPAAQEDVLSKEGFVLG